MIKLNKFLYVYDCFTKWTEYNQIFIYSDPHFGDLESYQFRFPNTKINIKELDEMQVRNINKVCGKTSLLIILGNVGNIECVKKLKAGYKVLILGNHDRGASYYKRVIEHEAVTMKISGLNNTPITLKKEGKIIEDNHLFDEVYEGTLQINPKIMLSHEPVDYRYCLNIHGHVHDINLDKCNSLGYAHCYNCYEEGKKITYYHLNVVGEATNYTPVNLNKIIKSGLLKDILDIHRETVDRASKN